MVKHPDMHISFTYKVWFSTMNASRIQKVRCKLNRCWGKKTLKNNRQTGLRESLFRVTHHFGKRCRTNRRKLRAITAPYCRNIMEGKHGPKEKPYWKKKRQKWIGKLLPCSKVNSLNNQKRKKTLPNPGGYWEAHSRKELRAQVSWEQRAILFEAQGVLRGGPNTLDVEPVRFSVKLETQRAPQARGPATSMPGLHRLAPEAPVTLAQHLHRNLGFLLCKSSRNWRSEPVTYLEAESSEGWLLTASF